MSPLTLSHQRLPGVTVIAVCGEMDATNRGEFEAYVAKARSSPGERLVFDLSRVPFMDSSGLHVLLTCTTDRLRHGGAVHLASAQPLPTRLFEITGVSNHVPVHDSVEDAITAARASAPERSF
ncbi:STAS domain-containing protein [Nonomuraea purpurea]|uniref:Anti-sigma factor antagonist n=1 Tax=Nonomuraea purpurea TaxID=1849276 RepID=A0ABV8G4M1_9ACTN